MVLEFFKKIGSIFNSYDFWSNFKWSLDVVSYKLYNIILYSFILSVLFASVIYISPLILLIPIGIVIFEAYIHMVTEQTYNLKKYNNLEGNINKEDFNFSNIIGLTLLFIFKIFLTLIGAVFFVLPGLYIYIKMSFARHCYIYYDDITVRKSIVKSWKLTKGNNVKLILLYFYILFLFIFALLPYLILIIIAMSEFGWSRMLITAYVIPLLFLLINIHHSVLQIMITKLFLDNIDMKNGF